MLNNYSPRTKILAGATIISATGALASFVYDKISMEKPAINVDEVAEKACEVINSDAAADAVESVVTAIVNSASDAAETIE